MLCRCTPQHSDSHHCISVARLFGAEPCLCVTLPCFATADHGCSLPLPSISMPLLRRYDLCHAIALPLLSFRCHAVAQLIEADPLLGNSGPNFAFAQLYPAVRSHSEPCLRLAFPRLSIASLSMPTQGVSIHCRCAAYLSNASPLLRCTRLFVATPLLHFAAPQRLIRLLSFRIFIVSTDNIPILVQLIPQVAALT